MNFEVLYGGNIFFSNLLDAALIIDNLLKGIIRIFFKHSNYLSPLW
jgi:hypothetical protein